MISMDARTVKAHLVYLAWLLLAVLLDGTVLQWFSPDVWGFPWMIAPHLTLVVTVWWAAQHGTYPGLVAGLAVGLLKDFVYGVMLGPSAVAFGLVGLLAGSFSRLIQPGMSYLLLLTAFGDLLYQAVLLAVYRLFAPVPVPWDWVLLYRMLPTLLANVAWATALYPFLRRSLHWAASSEGGRNR
jgi:rod shape-determining protein MreD